MNEIWKFPLDEEKLESDGRFSVKIKAPGQLVPISVGIQEGVRPMLWAEVNPAEHFRDYEIMMIGTGRQPPYGKFIGTIFIGPLVWHVYLKLDPQKEFRNI